MNYSERISSLLHAKSLLLPGGLLTIIETPNRLWFMMFILQKSHFLMGLILIQLFIIQLLALDNLL